MSPAGIEQDRVFESLIAWVLVRCVDVIDPNFAGYLPRRFQASAIGGGAVHDLSAGLNAALLGDAQGCLRCCGDAGNEQGCGEWSY
jgi:hypothetical protein